MKNDSHLLIWLTLFALALAQVEASIAVYLRNLFYPENPLQLFPMPMFSQHDINIEMSREAATVVMIVALVYLIKGRMLRRFAAFLFLFGLWDIFYYIFLKLMMDWPQNWSEWDLLFLIPLPWMAPWLTAAMIAVIFVVFGATILTKGIDASISQMIASYKLPLILFTLGAVAGVISFLLPALPLLQNGELGAAMQGFVPSRFSWLSYVIGILLMLAGLIGLLGKRDPSITMS